MPPFSAGEDAQPNEPVQLSSPEHFVKAYSSLHLHTLLFSSLDSYSTFFFFLKRAFLSQTSLLQCLHCQSCRVILPPKAHPFHTMPCAVWLACFPTPLSQGFYTPLVQKCWNSLLSLLTHPDTHVRVPTHTCTPSIRGSTTRKTGGAGRDPTDLGKYPKNHHEERNESSFYVTLGDRTRSYGVHL